MRTLNMRKPVLACLIFTVLSVFYFVGIPWEKQRKIFKNKNLNEYKSNPDQRNCNEFFFYDKPKKTIRDISLSKFYDKRFDKERKCIYHVIFDASKLKTNNKIRSLSFLDTNQPPGWCVLVTNLDNPSINPNCKNCVLLQNSWVDKRVTFLIRKKFGSLKNEIARPIINKMAAYVFVLEQSSEWIYVTDRISPVPYDSLMRPINKKINTGLVYVGDDMLFTPCNHFVDPETLKNQRGETSQSRYNIKSVSNHSVYYVIDSCFQQDSFSISQKKVIDERAPIPYIMPGTYGPVDFNNVLVSDTDAWTLVAGFFPIKNNPEDIKINMMVQRILWETEGTIGFIPAISDNFKTTGCTACDLENKINSIKSEFPNKLLSWKCESSLSLQTCLEQLVSQLESTSDTIQLVNIWVYLFNQYKHPFGVRTQFSEKTLKDKKNGTRLYFSPASLFHVKAESNISNPFTSRCSIQDRHYPTVIPHQHPITNVALIIIFNFASHVGNIHYFNYVYGRHFKYIIYCSESLDEFEEKYQSRFPNNPVTFLEVRIIHGILGQSCMSESMKMVYDVDGYLQMSDDVLLNAWNIENLPFDKPWFQPSVRVVNLNYTLVPDIWIQNRWGPWTVSGTRDRARLIFQELQNKTSHPIEGDRVSRFMNNIQSMTRCDRCLLYEASDIFYIPSHLANEYTFFTEIFTRNELFLEISIPSIIYGISSPLDVYRLYGNYLWFEDRKRYPYVYQQFDHFLHPLKFSQLQEKENLRFFCTKFLALIDCHLQTRPCYVR